MDWVLSCLVYLTDLRSHLLSQGIVFKTYHEHNLEQKKKYVGSFIYLTVLSRIFFLAAVSLLLSLILRHWAYPLNSWAPLLFAYTYVCLCTVWHLSLYHFYGEMPSPPLRHVCRQSLCILKLTATFLFIHSFSLPCQRSYWGSAVCQALCQVLELKGR